VINDKESNNIATKQIYNKINNQETSSDNIQPGSLLDINTHNNSNNPYNNTNTNTNLNKESLNSNNNINDKVEKQAININLSLSRYVELKSHFDVVRKLGYLPNINALVSVSEVI
jgi:hypothetical protein